SSWAAVASSFKPRPIVLTAMPVARDTAAIPPYPAVRASVAANSRRLRSSRSGISSETRANAGRIDHPNTLRDHSTAENPTLHPIHLFPDSHLGQGGAFLARPAL